MSQMKTMYRVLARTRKYEKEPGYKGFEIGIVPTEKDAQLLCQRHMEFIGDPKGKHRYATYETFQVPAKKSDFMEKLDKEFASDLRELENELPF